MTHVASEVIRSSRTEHELRERQAQARYPQLLGEAPAREGVMYRRTRDGTGLVVTALRHDALTPTQAAALAEFRLQQYVLSGWYELDALDQHGALTDPAFEDLPWNTFHVLAGTSAGSLLAYFCMQPASDVAAPRGTLRLVADAAGRQPTMGARERPRFPTEIHSFSPRVFTSLPALRSVPVQRVRELSRLLRNQTTHSLLSAIAVVEAVCAMTLVAMDPESAISVMLGCVDLEARQVTAHLGIPILFAPLAPTIPAPTEAHEFYWANRANEQGRFWPFVIATDDLRPLARRFAHLDTMLGGTPQEVRRGIVALRRHTHPLQVLTLAHDLDASPVFWTPDSFFKPPLAATADPLELPPPVAPATVLAPAPDLAAATNLAPAHAPAPTGARKKSARPARKRSPKRVVAKAGGHSRRPQRRSGRRSTGRSAKRAAKRASRRGRR